ncbi:MAG: His/Gly/Thr/Pro-type tRNA ligase C-terminal domain-containing protein [Pollutimonas bauzanensis]
MFADWELVGVPVRVTIGDRGLKENLIEIQTRRQETAAKIPVTEALAHTLEQLKSL